MSNLFLSTETEAGYTSVSDIFIDEYVPSANGEFVKIYLYLLRLMACNSKDISVSSLADKFNQTEADVMRALRYWDKLDILKLSYSEQGNELRGITIKNLNRSTEDPQPANVPVQTAAMPVPIKIEVANSVESEKPQYSADKLNELSSNEEFSMLLFVASTYLGKNLSQSETNSIIYFYDTLQLPADLIVYLFEHCLSKGKNNMRYIEKVAISWAERNITTVEQAKLEASTHSEAIYQVMNAFGIKNRELGKYELDFIIKWTDNYAFDTDMIVEACNRTIKATHQPSFEYADTILSKWNAANVRSTDDILKSDAEFEANKAVKPTVTASKPTNNRFNNFPQRPKKSADFYNSLLSNNS